MRKGKRYHFVAPSPGLPIATDAGRQTVALVGQGVERQPELLCDEELQSFVSLLGHVLLDAPFARQDELAALREATHQLRTLGVLVNQVARALNSQLRSPRGDTDALIVPAGLLDQCRAEISSVADAAHRVIEANRQVYRRKTPKEEVHE